MISASMANAWPTIALASVALAVGAGVAATI
jgi:hypothetical protein